MFLLTALEVSHVVRTLYMAAVSPEVRVPELGSRRTRSKDHRHLGDVNNEVGDANEVQEIVLIPRLPALCSVLDAKQEGNDGILAETDALNKQALANPDPFDCVDDLCRLQELNMIT